MTKGSKGRRQLATAICTAGLLGSLALPTLAMARAQSAQGAQGCQACGDCQTQSISEDDVSADALAFTEEEARAMSQGMTEKDAQEAVGRLKGLSDAERSELKGLWMGMAGERGLSDEQHERMDELEGKAWRAALDEAIDADASLDDAAKSALKEDASCMDQLEERLLGDEAILNDSEEDAVYQELDELYQRLNGYMEKAGDVF